MFEKLRAMFAQPETRSDDLTAAAQSIDLAGAQDALVAAEAARARAIVEGGAAELRSAETALELARLHLERLTIAKAEIERRRDAAAKEEREEAWRRERAQCDAALDAAADLALCEFDDLVARLQALREVIYAADRNASKFNERLLQDDERKARGENWAPTVNEIIARRGGRKLRGLGALLNACPFPEPESAAELEEVT